MKKNDGETGRRETARGGKGRRGRRGQAAEQPNVLLDWGKTFLVAALLFFFVRTFIIQTFVITSGSMKETLQVGDMLVVNRLGLGSRVPLLGFHIPGYREPHRNDIVVFEPPPPDTIGMKLVKRLVGMPGDTLQMRDRVLYIDGEAQKEPWVVHHDSPDETYPWMVWQKDYLVSTVDKASYRPTRDNWGPLVIPDGYYFMMGDNREESFDSRYWGIVERWRLEGRPVLIYFSYNRESYRPFPWLREIRWSRIGGVGP